MGVREKESPVLMSATAERSVKAIKDHTERMDCGRKGKRWVCENGKCECKPIGERPMWRGGSIKKRKLYQKKQAFSKKALAKTSFKKKLRPKTSFKKK